MDRDCHVCDFIRVRNQKVCCFLFISPELRQSRVLLHMLEVFQTGLLKKRVVIGRQNVCLADRRVDATRIAISVQFGIAAITKKLIDSSIC